MSHTRSLLLAFMAALACEAQTREIGILGGGGFLTGSPVSGAAASVTAGFSPGLAAGAFIGQDLYPRLSGEIRYLFEQRDPRLQSGDVRSSFAGQAHAIHYDLVWHANTREDRVRPYVAVGGGVKVFRGTGAEVAYRPLMEYAYLTRTQELKPMMTFGGGVKIRLGRQMIARMDLRDQLTRFPTKVITPAKGMSLSGWLHDFVPVVGVSWIF